MVMTRTLKSQSGGAWTGCSLKYRVDHHLVRCVLERIEVCLSSLRGLIYFTNHYEGNSFSEEETQTISLWRKDLVHLFSCFESMSVL